MKLSEVYINTTAAAVTPGHNKVVLSNDAYAICEFIEKLWELEATKPRG